MIVLFISCFVSCYSTHSYALLRTTKVGLHVKNLSRADSDKHIVVVQRLERTLIFL